MASVTVEKLAKTEHRVAWKAVDEALGQLIWNAQALKSQLSREPTFVSNESRTALLSSVNYVYKTGANAVRVIGQELSWLL